MVILPIILQVCFSIPANGGIGLYNAFLAPGSPCELNIDHNLRNSLAARMTRAVGDDAAMMQSLEEVVTLFKEAQSSVFKLMSSVRAPQLKALDTANMDTRIRCQSF